MLWKYIHNNIYNIFNSARNTDRREQSRKLVNIFIADLPPTCLVRTSARTM